MIFGGCLQDFWWVSSRFLASLPGPPPPLRRTTTLRAPTLRAPPKTKLAKCGLAKFGQQKMAKFGQIRMAKCGQLTLAKCGVGQIRFGQMRSGPSPLHRTPLRTPHRTAQNFALFSPPPLPFALFLSLFHQLSPIGLWTVV